MNADSEAFRIRELYPFPREAINEHPAIDKLRQVCNLGKAIANLLRDAQDTDEPDYADMLEQVAREASETMLMVAEDALREMTNNKRDNEVAMNMESVE